MELFDRFEPVEPYPALYDPVADVVAVADLHLGLESLMAKAGALMPKFQREEMEADLLDVLERTGAATLVVCGDIKHEFSETSYGEREEVRAFLDAVADAVDEVLLVKGNHDNYLHYAVEDVPDVELADRFVREGTLYIHGHELVEDLETLDAEFVVMGHEHPAVTLTDDVGVTEKVACFLYGTMDDGRKLVVLPAFSKLAEGSQVNQAAEDDLLSPVLKRKIDVGSMRAVGVDREAGLLPFPELSTLR